MPPDRPELSPDRGAAPGSGPAPSTTAEGGVGPGPGDRLDPAEPSFRDLAESLSDLVWSVRPDGHPDYLNRRFLDYLGVDSADLGGWDRPEILHPDDAEEAGRAWEAARASGDGFEVEARLRRFDGDYRWHRARGSPIRDRSGRIVRWFGTWVDVDVDDRRRADGDHERFFDVGADLLVVSGFDGYFKRVSPACERTLGWTPEELTARPWVEFLHPDDREPTVSLEAEVIRGREVFSFENRYLHKDGTYRWLDWKARAYPAERAIYAGAIDVTERKRAEVAVRESERRWRTMAEALPNLVWTDTPDGQCDWLSSQWGKYTGIPESQLLGTRWIDEVLHPDDRQRTLDCWRAACEDRGDYDLEYRIRRHDGAYRWFKTRGVPIRDDSGRIVYWFGTCTDIEDQKRALAALREGRERLRIALAASDTGTFRWEPETGAFLEFDDNLKRLFGFPAERPVRFTEDFLGPIHPDDLPALAQAVERCRRGDDFEMEYRVILPDGAIRWLYDRGKMIQDDSGRPAYLVGACTDITKRKRVEEALQDADRRKDEFLATLAHELRNPLAPIRNALLLMREPSTDRAGIERDRAMAERQVRHLARLIDDLMDVARISRGKIELRREVVDLQTIVRQAVETARTLIDDRRQTLDVQVPDEPVRLEGDPTRLEQVLWNLLNNAAKYTEPGGKIALTAAREGSMVAIRVRDDGIGIDPAMLPRLFQMFVQVGEHREHAQGGLGIGLGLVRTLIEMHGGTISARSDGPGTGSEFEVRLPALPASAPAPSSPRSDRNGPARRLPTRRRVLVVDDNVDAAESLGAILGRICGQEVRIAHDGPRALEIADEFRPEVVLLDIGLPGMDGHEVARRLRDRPEFRSTPIVALTGWGQAADRKRSSEAGFDLHLVKPVDPDALIDFLSDAPRMAPEGPAR